MNSITFDTGIIGKLRITEENQAVVRIEFVQDEEAKGTEADCSNTIHNERMNSISGGDTDAMEEIDYGVTAAADTSEEYATIWRVNTVLARARQQIMEYLEGEREEFTFPVRMNGTKFQKEVWTALLDIPYAETCSYGDVARAIGKPKACRAVGMANNKNPLPIVIPCHRVIGADGRMVGYAAGLDVKAKLQSIERQSVLAQIFGSGN